MKQTPLRRRTPLARTPFARNPNAKPMRRVSAKQRLVNAQWRKTRAAAFKAAGGVCVFEFQGVSCNRQATQGHHQLGRGQGGNTEPVCIPLCKECHDWCHAYPIEAAALGYIVRRSDYDPITPAKGDA